MAWIWSGRVKTERSVKTPPKVEGARIAIICAPYYSAVVETMATRAAETVHAAGAESERFDVPGAFELPGAIALLDEDYDGYIALGCVVRGETSHYDYVCGESARGLMDLSLSGIAVGYGILTVETLEQAQVRADPKQGDKGFEAANACLSMVALRRKVMGEGA
jgi:6,7-dimethyl-8-ribityllumazine synthase